MNEQSPDIKHPSEDAPVIEGFRVIEKLGHGATSSVWKAEQVSLNRLVVIKVLSERLSREPEDVKLFKAEARLAANFKHAGIVQVYDFGQSKTSQRYYFVMEYISGYSVGEWIRRKGKITEAEALVITHSVADALKYAWDLYKIVHCDIKPDNIMVDGDGSVKIADLGLAHTVKTIGSQIDHKATEVVITGTPNYMAPEQVRGTEVIDCRTDIYALGASLYHMVTGQLPFGESPPDVVMERQLHETFEYPQKVNPDLSTVVTRLIVKMTSKEPAARFQTWDAILGEVKRLERQMQQKAAGSTQPVAPADTLVKRSATADVKKSGALAEKSGRECPHCGKPVQSQVSYCGFCGKPVSASATEPIENQKQSTIRLKPIQASPTTKARPAAAPTAARVRRRRWMANLGGLVRMMLSLCLLTFLGYYAYQKVKYDRDVLIPIKAAIIRYVQPALERSRRAGEREFQKGARLSQELIWERLATKPPPPIEKPRGGQKSIPKPYEKTESEEWSDEELTPEAEAPQKREPMKVVKEPVETVDEETSEAQAQPEKPAPAVSEPPKPEPAAAPVKSPQDIEYESILEKCKQQQPKAGSQITIRFKNNSQPVAGVLEKVTSEGVMVKIPAGVIEYPFRLMTEESRLQYFPAERARRLQRH